MMAYRILSYILRDVVHGTIYIYVYGCFGRTDVMVGGKGERRTVEASKCVLATITIYTLTHICTPTYINDNRETL
jgi:hypothetical protein